MNPIVVRPVRNSPRCMEALESLNRGLVTSLVSQRAVSSLLKNSFNITLTFIYMFRK